MLNQGGNEHYPKLGSFFNLAVENIFFFKVGATREEEFSRFLAWTFSRVMNELNTLEGEIVYTEGH